MGIVWSKVKEVSIFVEEGYRRCGLGDGFLRRALVWLAEKEAKEVKIMVACGNEGGADVTRATVLPADLRRRSRMINLGHPFEKLTAKPGEYDIIF